MGKETYALLTGLFIVILGSALVGISIWLGNYGEERDVYIVATQASVSGLNPESTVLYRGVQAGKVSAIRFDPKDSRNILVRIEVDKGLPITHGTFARLRIQGLTGLAQIELGDSGSDARPLRTSRENPAHIPLRPSLVDKLSDSGGEILLRAGELTTRLDRFLDDENLGRVRNILANLEAASARLPGLEERMDEAFAELGQAAKTVKGASEEAIRTGTKARQTLSRFDAAATEFGKLSERLETLAGSANDLARSATNVTDAATKTALPKLNGLLEELKSTSAKLRKLSRLLEKDPQALLYGRLPPRPGPGEPGYQEDR